MKNKFSIGLISLCVSLMSATASFNAQARNDASTMSAVSLLPVASVVGAVSGVGGAAVSALPIALSVAGPVLVISAVDASSKGTVYLLTRASDGATASIEVMGTAASAVASTVGTTVTVSVISTGVVLSVAGSVLAYIPNKLGESINYSKRISK